MTPKHYALAVEIPFEVVEIPGAVVEKVTKLRAYIRHKMRQEGRQPIDVDGTTRIRFDKVIRVVRIEIELLAAVS